MTNTAIKSAKQKVCPICKLKFVKVRAIQPCCQSFDCQIAYSAKLSLKRKAAQEKLDRKDARERKEKAKTRTTYLAEAQVVFNRFIRARDKNESCISCGRDDVVQWHAGHFKTVKAHPELRFCERNTHKQCSQCNDHKGGNISEYRPRLELKIGKEELERLDNSHELHKYTIEEAKQIKETYRKKLKALQV